MKSWMKFRNTHNRLAPCVSNVSKWVSERELELEKGHCPKHKHTHTHTLIVLWMVFFLETQQHKDSYMKKFIILEKSI